MAQIPYLIKKYTVNQIENEGFHMELMKESFSQPYELKQVVPIISEGDTEYVYGVFSTNLNLIKTIIPVNKNRDDVKYLTAEQISLIRDIGFLEVEGEKREISDISIKWNEDEVYGVIARISFK